MPVHLCVTSLSPLQYFVLSPSGQQSWRSHNPDRAARHLSPLTAGTHSSWIMNSISAMPQGGDLGAALSLLQSFVAHMRVHTLTQSRSLSFFAATSRSVRNASLIGRRREKKLGQEQSQETSKDWGRQGGGKGERWEEVEVCVWPVVFNSSFPAVRPAMPPGFHRKCLSWERGVRIRKKGAAAAWQWACEAWGEEDSRWIPS